MNAFRPHTSKIAAAALLTLLAGVAQAQSVALNNPSFENPSLGSPWYDSTGGASVIVGGAADGIKYVSLDAAESIYQSFSLGASGNYTVDFFAFGSGKSVLLNSSTFDAIDITEGADPANFARVTTGADAPAHLPERFLIDSGNSTAWNHYNYTFEGLAGSSYHLYFVGVGPQVFGVDGVGVAAAVPEPESFAMMLAGLGALGFMARRRKQA